MKYTPKYDCDICGKPTKIKSRICRECGDTIYDEELDIESLNEEREIKRHDSRYESDNREKG